MHHVIPGTFLPTTASESTGTSAGGTVGSGAGYAGDYIPNYSGNNCIWPSYPSYPYYPQLTYSPYQLISTTTTTMDKTMEENEVTIEQVDNGFIIETKDKTLVAANLISLYDVLREHFTLKLENK